MQRMMVMVFATMLLLPFAGCLEQDEAINEAGTFSLSVEWTTIPLESKSGYYEDEQSISWDVASDSVSDQIGDSGGIVVGVLMPLPVATSLFVAISAALTIFWLLSSSAVMKLPVISKSAVEAAMSMMISFRLS